MTSTAAVIVQKLPYIPPTDPNLRFDKYQFARRNLHVVNATNGISFQDYNGMHVDRRELNASRARYIPAFANNDELLRLVLAQSAWQYIKRGYGRTGRVPDAFVKHPRLLEKLCDARVASNARREVKTGRGSSQDWIHRAHVMHMHEHGGYMHFQARVAYLSFRLGMKSVEIALEMRIAPSHARQIVQRLCDTARWLGLETFPRHKTYGMHRTKKMPPQRYDLTGKKFGMLTVIAFDRYRGPYAYYFCKCDCGRRGRQWKRYLGKSLSFSDTRSCGCLYRQKKKREVA